jgi:hypothetical protein
LRSGKLMELDAECLFVLQRASQETAHLIISDFGIQSSRLFH